MLNNEHLQCNYENNRNKICKNGLNNLPSLQVIIKFYTHE